MITTADLKTQTRRDLADTARDHGIAGWHSMRKDELIEAIRKAQRRVRRKSSGKSRSTNGDSPTTPAKQPTQSRSRSSENKGSISSKGGRRSTVGKAKSSAAKSLASKASTAKKPSHNEPRPATAPRVVKALRKRQAAAEHRKDLSASVVIHTAAAKTGAGQDQPRPHKDRIVLIVRDAFWLQASWEITRTSVERARAAMKADWHTAEPVLRLLEVAHGASANTAEQVVRDIPIHGGVSNWYIDVENPPSRYRVIVGYKSSTGRLYTLCRSNVVQTPAPGACDPIDGHWQSIAEDYERIYSMSDNENGTGSGDLREMFEERLRRPMTDSRSDSYGAGNELSLRRERDLPFEVDAELIVYGSTTPGASVTLAGEPVRLRPDGTFTVRMDLPDRRQVLPVVACSRDGLRQRTTVVAVERNTKVMEPVSRNQMD